MHNITETIKGILAFRGDYTPRSNFFLFESIREYYEKMEELEKETPYFARIFGRPYLSTFLSEGDNSLLIVNLEGQKYLGLVFSLDQYSVSQDQPSVITRMPFFDLNKTLKFLKSSRINSLLVSKEKKGFFNLESFSEQSFSSAPKAVSVFFK